MESYSRVTGWRELFFLYNPLNFRRLSQSLLLGYIAENLQVTFFKGELFSCLPKVDHVINECKKAYLTFFAFWRLARMVLSFVYFCLFLGVVMYDNELGIK